MNQAQIIERNTLKYRLASSDFSAQKEDYFLALFAYQYKYNELYAEFCNLLKISPQTVTSISQIPHLPISFFKSHTVVSRKDQASLFFKSSGTTGMSFSKHALFEEQLYIDSFLSDFKFAYGNPADYCFLFLLPGYMEREGSSLIYMCEHLRKLSKYTSSGFYLKSNQELLQIIAHNKEAQIPTMLFGVSFAFVDLTEEGVFDFSSCILMETGGMKGRRVEPTRQELHALYRNHFQIIDMHSEYGMTELLSQAYSKADGKFIPSPKMHISIYESDDPMQQAPIGKTGAINIMDGANIDSCAFIATQDLGKINADGSFEIIGRFDHSDLRGCSLLLT